MTWGDWLTTGVTPPDPTFTGTVRLTIADEDAGADRVNATVSFGPDALWVGTAQLAWKGIPGEGTLLTYRLKYYEAISHSLLWDSGDQLLDEAGQDVSLAFDFHWHQMHIGMCVGVEPGRHATVAHPDEVHLQEAWQGDTSTTADGAWKDIARNQAAGAAFLATQNGLKLQATCSFDEGAHVAGNAGYFTDLHFLSAHPPCGDITFTADGSETIEGWYDLAYETGPSTGPTDAVLVRKWNLEYRDAQVVDALECGKTGGPTYQLVSQLDGYAKLLWKTTSASLPDSDYNTFYADPRLFLKFHAPWVAGNSEADADLFGVIEHPLLTEVGRTTLTPLDAIDWSHKPEIEVEFPDGDGSRKSNWAATGGSAGVTCTNAANFTQFQVASGGSGGAERTFVDDYPDTLSAEGAAGIHKQKRQDTAHDVCNWSNYGFLKLPATFTWSAATDRLFRLEVVATVYTFTRGPFAWTTADETWTWDVPVREDQKGFADTYRVDLMFPREKVEPRLYHVKTVRFTGLVEGDDILLEGMAVHRYNPTLEVEGAADTSPAIGVRVPWANSRDDVLCLVGRVSGGRCFDRTTDNVYQEGAETGIPHFDRDSDELTIAEIAEWLNEQQGFEAAVEAAVAASPGPFDDGTNPTTPYAFYLRQTHTTEAATTQAKLQAVFKARYLEPAQCIPYRVRWDLGMVVRGALEGIAYYGDHEERAGAGETISVNQCSGGVPTLTVAGSGVTDDWGHYTVGGLYEELAYAPQ